MSIVMSVMVLAVSFATRALPAAGTAEQDTLSASDLVDQVAADLALATAFVTSESDTVEFTVPDRSHGAAGPETIHYEWSGTLGDPLILSYNGSSSITLCTDVQEFSLEFIEETNPLVGAPRVALIVDNSTMPRDEDVWRKKTIEDWGFNVLLVEDAESQDFYDEIVASHDVAYVSETVQSPELNYKLRDATIGVVLEDGLLYDEFGIASSSWIDHDDEIFMIDNSHEITFGFAVGRLVVCSSNQDLVGINGTLAPDSQTLANVSGSASESLLILESGDDLYDGGTASGRRVKLPWGNGGTGFDFTKLNANGLTLMRRAIVWAAASRRIVAVRITFQVGTDPSNRFETQVQLLNQPEMQ